MASRPPLGLSLADILGASSPAPKMSRGQMILGILGDALAGAAGGTPTFGAMQMKQREAAQESADFGRKLMQKQLIEQQFPKPRDPTSSQQDYEYAKANGFNGSFTDFLQYTHPPSPVTVPYGATVQTPNAVSAPTADGMPMAEKPEDAAKLPPGTRFKMPDGRIGTVPGGVGGNAGGMFPASYSDIGPYHRY